MYLTDLGYFNIQQLIDNLDRDLQYAITVEGKMDLESVSNYDEVKNAIMEKVLVFCCQADKLCDHANTWISLMEVPSNIFH